MYQNFEYMILNHRFHHKLLYKQTPLTFHIYVLQNLYTDNQGNYRQNDRNYMFALEFHSDNKTCNTYKNMALEYTHQHNALPHIQFRQ